MTRMIALQITAEQYAKLIDKTEEQRDKEYKFPIRSFTYRGFSPVEPLYRNTSYFEPLCKEDLVESNDIAYHSINVQHGNFVGCSFERAKELLAVGPQVLRADLEYFSNPVEFKKHFSNRQLWISPKIVPTYDFSELKHLKTLLVNYRNIVPTLRGNINFLPKELLQGWFKELVSNYSSILFASISAMNDYADFASLTYEKEKKVEEFPKKIDLKRCLAIRETPSLNATILGTTEYSVVIESIQKDSDIVYGVIKNNDKIAYIILAVRGDWATLKPL